MAAYIVRRILWGLLVLVAVGAFTFVLAFIAPGDPARAIAGRNASAEAVENIRQALGMDRPLPEQMISYFVRALQGDFGISYRMNRPVLDIVLARVPATFELALTGVAFALLIGIPLGVRSARKPGGRVDRAGLLGTTILVAAPAFWVGYVLLFLLAFQPAIQWDITIFPIGQYKPWDLRYLFLPALTLAVGLAAYYARLTRTLLLDELHQDYIRTARAKGASEGRVAWRHALPNALPPLLTQIGLDLGLLFGGVIVVEVVYSWPGIGKLALDAVATEDLPLLLGTVLFATVCIVIVNIIVDVAIVVIDPRIRDQR